jgi:hypothetical protein
VEVIMTIHVRTWPGSGSATVTDMTHAGRRGRKCRTLRVSGWLPEAWDDTPAGRARRHTFGLLAALDETKADEDFDAVRKRVRDLVAAARQDGVPEGNLTSYDEEIRGIDAPRPKLTAGVAGKWSAYADESGIHLYALDDPWNEWTEITHNQTEAAAYAIACKVWPLVQKAQTLHEAATILRAAGARLHGYCAID